MKILNREKVYFNRKPQYFIIYDEEENKSYDLIVERFSYYDFKIYYNSETYPNNENKKEEIESFLIENFLDYELYNNI